MQRLYLLCTIQQPCKRTQQSKTSDFPEYVLASYYRIHKYLSCCYSHPPSAIMNVRVIFIQNVCISFFVYSDNISCQNPNYDFSWSFDNTGLKSKNQLSRWCCYMPSELFILAFKRQWKCFKILKVLHLRRTFLKTCLEQYQHFIWY